MLRTPVLLSPPVGHRPGADIESILRIAVQAEAVGFGGVVVTDHVVMGSRLDRYPWGTFMYGSDALG